MNKPPSPPISESNIMSVSSIFSAIIKSTPHLTRLSLNLIYMYLTLGNKVRKTRRAFEKQLVNVGMSKEDAERLSFCFEELKENITSLVRSGIAGIQKR